MEKNILIIDDVTDKRGLEAFKEDLEYEVNQNSNLTYSINLNSENPLPYIDFTKPEREQYNGLFQFLDQQYLSKKLDMFLCDFNLHAQHKHIAFHIINHVRSRNKACTIILFSGSPLKELIRLNNSDLAEKIREHILQENTGANASLIEKKLEQLRKEEEPAEELMAMAVKSHISAIVSRPKYEETAKELIKQPSVLLWIENELMKNGELVFNDGHEKLNGMKLEVVAKHIREQTEEGIYFTSEIIRLSLANLLILNS